MLVALGRVGPQRLVGMTRLVRWMRIEHVQIHEEWSVLVRVDPVRGAIDVLTRRLARVNGIGLRRGLVDLLEPFVKIGEPAGEHHRRQRDGGVTGGAVHVGDSRDGGWQPIRLSRNAVCRRIERCEKRRRRHLGPGSLRHRPREHRALGRELAEKRRRVAAGAVHGQMVRSQRVGVDPNHTTRSHRNPGRSGLARSNNG